MINVRKLRDMGVSRSLLRRFGIRVHSDLPVVQRPSLSRAEEPSRNGQFLHFVIFSAEHKVQKFTPFRSPKTEVITTDVRDFRIYRRNRNDPIPLIHP